MAEDEEQFRGMGADGSEESAGGLCGCGVDTLIVSMHSYIALDAGLHFYFTETHCCGAWHRGITTDCSSHTAGS